MLEHDATLPTRHDIERLRYRGRYGADAVSYTAPQLDPRARPKEQSGPGPALGGPPRYRFYVLRVTGPFMHLYNVLNNLTLAARDRRVRNNPQFARFHLW